MIPGPPLSREHLFEMVRRALAEDTAASDATVAYAGVGDRVLDATLVAGEGLVVAGLQPAREVFRALEPAVSVEALCADGDRVQAGTEILRVRGTGRCVLGAERTALNFLQRMCGVATHAARFVAAVAGTGVTILDTRKTIPLWRELDKYAVRCGGASNHRQDLRAMVLLKDNHVRALGGPDAMLAHVAHAPRAAFVELEVDSAAFLADLLASPACDRVDRVMLDNFAPAGVVTALERIAAWRAARAGRRVEVEVSGGVTLATVRAYALPGVDFISVGAITHSAPAASMSLDVR